MQTTELFGDKVVLVTMLVHTSGQWTKSYLPLNPTKNDSQGMGAAITYLRRYSLSALVGVVCDDDDDGETAVGRGKTAKPVAQPQASQVVEKLDIEEQDELLLLTEKLDTENRRAFYSWVQKTFNTSSLTDIPKMAFANCVSLLNAKIKFQNEKSRQAVAV